MTGTRIQVATDRKIAQLRVAGKATFNSAQSVREFALKMLDAGVKRVLVDLSECVTMDSTFMGVLALTVVRGRERQVTVEIVNANDNVKKLLASLGLKRLFVFSQTRSPEVDWTALCQAKADNAEALGQQRTILEAHETLMQVDPENVPKFKDVVEFLRSDLKAHEQKQQA